MKKLSSSFLKALVVIVLFTGGSFILSTTGVKAVTEAQAAVSEAEVVEYLEEYGYQVVSAAPKPGTIADWKCHTILNGTHYWTTVHVVGTNIVGHDNTPF